MLHNQVSNSQYLLFKRLLRMCQQKWQPKPFASPSKTSRTPRSTKIRTPPCEWRTRCRLHAHSIRHPENRGSAIPISWQHYHFLLFRMNTIAFWHSPGPTSQLKLKADERPCPTNSMHGVRFWVALVSLRLTILVYRILLSPVYPISNIVKDLLTRPHTLPHYFSQ
jgi:hypothetical protein